ncbi:MAG TPA: hypothetical protein VFF69_15025 [Phycisphaerales bacterium]|nr:hypothetical protein [Phycisphaerales bacterium]
MLARKYLCALAACASAIAIGAVATTLAANPVAPNAPTGESVKPAYCLMAFSKDICDGYLMDGFGYSYTCSTGTTDCASLHVEGATLKLSLKSNSELCDCSTFGDCGRCDESPKLDGTLVGLVNYDLRLNRPCPYRGCLDGDASFTTVSGAVFRGTITGTLGVGTHRKIACHTLHQRDCETCLDTELIADTDPATWRIGTELVFKGIRADIDTGEELCFSLSGDFFTPAADDGSIADPMTYRTFTGAADGVHLDPCS